MTSSGLRRSVRLPAVACFTLLAWGVVFPSRADAGCDRYANHLSSHEGLGRFLDPLVVGGEANWAGGERSPANDPARPRPCSGPSCSGRPTVPTLPSVTVIRFVEP